MSLKGLVQFRYQSVEGLQINRDPVAIGTVAGDSEQERCPSAIDSCPLDAEDGRATIDAKRIRMTPARRRRLYRLFATPITWPAGRLALVRHRGIFI